MEFEIKISSKEQADTLNTAIAFYRSKMEDYQKILQEKEKNCKELLEDCKSKVQLVIEIENQLKKSVLK